MKFRGIQIVDSRLKDYKLKAIENAIYKGSYTGSPGRDIYYMLPFLTDKQMEEVANMIETKFPKVAPGNHVNVGQFLRFLYGQFEKEGILRSDKDCERMKRDKLEWDMSIKFVKLLYEKLEKNDNFYGMSIINEMNAHRIGDKAILTNDLNRLVEMEKLYNVSVELAYKCKSYKHMFTPYYWCFRYFNKIENKEKALSYAYLTMKNANKYCPDPSPGYVYKFLYCIRYIRKHDKSNWTSFYKKYKKSKNRCIKKTFQKYRS